MSAAGRRVRHAHRELGPVFLPEQAKRYGLVSKPPSHCSPVRHVLGVGLWIPGLVVEPALELGLAQSLGWQQTGGPNIQGRTAKGAGPEVLAECSHDDTDEDDETCSIEGFMCCGKPLTLKEEA